MKQKWKEWKEWKEWNNEINENFDLEAFLNNLKEQLQSNAMGNLTSSVSSNSANLTHIFENILYKHASLRPMSKREKRLSQKPWISNEIVQLIKTKNQLFYCYSFRIMSRKEKCLS